jgi:hypothetical protein
MDFEFIRGDTKPLLKFKLKDKEGNELSLSPTDKLFFTVKQNSKAKKVIIQKTIGNGITIGDDGYIHIRLESDDTAEIAYGTYGYDIELKTATGIVKTLTLGTITLTDEFTWKGDEN